MWGQDGLLYYWRLDQLVAARLEPSDSGAELAVRARTPLFESPFVENILPNYDVSPDGTRFAVVLGETRASRLVVALDALGPRRSGGASRP